LEVGKTVVDGCVVLSSWKVDGPEAGACSCAFEDDGLVVDDVDMVGREEGNATMVAEYANGQRLCRKSGMWCAIRAVTGSIASGSVLSCVELFVVPSGRRHTNRIRSRARSCWMIDRQEVAGCSSVSDGFVVEGGGGRLEEESRADL
jgi:hypothetical protein